MEVCVNCKENALLGKSIADGVLCKACYNKIPKLIRPYIKGYSSYDIASVLSNTEKNKEFSPTATYGKLQIDDLHGMFAVETKGELSIFNCLDLEEIGLYCTSPSVDRNNSVYCNVEFSCKLAHSNIQFKTEVKTHVNCRSHKTDSSHLEWTEPGDLSMFRNMFMQAFENAKTRYNRTVGNNLVSKHDIEILKAEALFMVDGQYSDTYLMETKDKLLQVFTGEQEQNKIKQAYALLFNS